MLHGRGHELLLVLNVLVRDHRRAMGVGLCLSSAACFGAMAIFGTLAYDDGVGVMTLLLVRFGLAAVLFWLIAAARGARTLLGAMPARTRATALGLGAVGYAAQAGLYFAALERIDPASLSLLLYTYPAMVTAAALLLRREAATPRRLAALAAASGGVALVLVGAGAGSFDAVGVAMGIGAALVYTTYILVADTVIADVDPLPLSALVATGAAGTFAVVGVGSGSVDVGFAAGGWFWLACIALVSTVAAVLAFFAGLRRVGPSAASILSTFEPVVTIALAFACFGDRLAPVQLMGGALVLAAVVILQAGAMRRAEPAAVQV
jgi:drug/metabolite transporter (DMT)-like permease